MNLERREEAGERGGLLPLLDGEDEAVRVVPVGRVGLEVLLNKVARFLLVQ
jgi:hypothetical protein